MGKNKANKANANCNQVILDHFWNVCDQSEEKRCRSIQVILQTLAHQTKLNSNHNDVSYCLSRLVTGLLSTREFARHGFCVLLTKILEQFQEESDIENVLSLAEKEYGENISKASSESAISWSLLIGCIVRSGRVTPRDSTIEKLFDYMFQLGSKKNYVEIIVCNLLPIFFDIFQSDPNQFKKVILEAIKTQQEGGHMKSTFFTYVVLLALNKYSSISESHFNDYISNHIYKKKSKDYSKVLSILKETTKYYPNIHPINELLIQTLSTIDSSNLSHFCSSLIEDIFKVNLEKTSLGFEIVRILLKLVNSKQVELVLSSNFMRPFIQTLCNKKHPLHNSATELGQFFIAFSQDKQNDSEFQVALAKCFINKPGSINFDELSKSKILASILRNFTNDSIRAWILMLEDMMINEENIPTSDFYRIRCLQQIAHLLKSYTKNDQFLWTISKFLFVYAYFDVSACKNFPIDDKNLLEQFSCPLSEKLQKQFPDYFKAIFAHLVHLSTSDVNLQQDKLEKQIEILSSMVDFIGTLLKRKKVTLLSNEIDADTIRQTITDLKEKVQQMSSVKNQSIETNIFKFFYLYFIVELFENSEEILAILPDFNECANRSLLVTKKSKKTNDLKNGHTDEPLWADVLTDLFLSLLTTKSKYTKNVIMNVFKHISPFVTQVGLQSLTDAILNKDALHSADSDSEDEDIDEADEMEVDPQEEEEDDDDDDDEDDDIMDDGENEVDEQFKLDVMKALGSAFDNENEDSDCMSDSEMFKIDESLAEVFKKKFGEKKQANERQNLIQTFKNRILELIQIIVESKEMSLEMTLDVLSSILTVAKSHYAIKSMSPFTSKCIQIFSIISKKRFTKEVTVDEASIRKVLDSLIDFQYKCSHTELQKTLISLTSWLITVSKSQLSCLQLFQAAIDRSLKDFFERPNVELKANLFIRLIPQICEAKQESFFKSDNYEVLLDYSFKPDIRSFKKCSAIEILCSILNGPHHSTDQAAIAKLATRTISLLIDELANLSATKEDKQSGTGQTKLQYVNLLGKLAMTCNMFGTNNTKVGALIKQLNLKLDSTPKEFRKKLDKAFVRKVRGVLAD